MSNRRYQILLGVAIVLAVLRFALQPWVSHQMQRRDELQVLTKRYDRSEALVEARESINRQFSQFSEELLRVQSLVPVAASADDFRLVVQQQIGAIAQESGVGITVFDFLLESSREGTALKVVRVRLELVGAMNRVARFQGDLEGRLQNAAIQNFRMTTPFPAIGPGDMNVQSSMLVDLYFRIPAKENAQ